VSQICPRIWPQDQGGILGRNWDKNLKTFTPCFSLSPPLEYLSPAYGFLGLEITKATDESGRGLGFVYIISLFFSRIMIDSMQSKSFIIHCKLFSIYIFPKKI
jgi:hypothetical protein